MKYLYIDLFDSDFIKPPFSPILMDNDTIEKVINHNVVIFTNSTDTLKLCLKKDVSFTSNELCVILINKFNLKNDFSKYELSLLNFFHKNHSFNPLKTTTSFCFIRGINKISYELLFLSR